MSELTPDEQAELMAVAQRMAVDAVRALRDAGVLTPQPTLPELSYRDCDRLSWQFLRQANALGWLCQQLYPVWAPWPDKPLSDVLKTLPRERIERFAHELGLVGMHDLDELLLPSDPDADGD
jgi:hypothetical protein